MPYILISTQIRLECGPTICGDEKSDPELMSYLGASLVQQVGNNFSEYRSDHPPRIVLDLLDSKGYTLVGHCGVGQTVIWTLHKPQLGQNGLQRKEYRSPDRPRVILDKLDARGYKLVGATGVGQTMIWTMYRPS